MAIKFNMRVDMSITVNIDNENQPLPFSRTEMAEAIVKHMVNSLQITGIHTEIENVRISITKLD
jgi:hypothetical protein